MSIRTVAVVATMVVASIPGASVAVAQEPPTRRPDVIYVPTPESVVEAMLQVANVGKNDIVYDLGCGDGRIPVTAAKKYGARGVGIASYELLRVLPDLHGDVHVVHEGTVLSAEGPTRQAGAGDLDPHRSLTPGRRWARTPAG